MNLLGILKVKPIFLAIAGLIVAIAGVLFITLQKDPVVSTTDNTPQGESYQPQDRDFIELMSGSVDDVSNVAVISKKEPVAGWYVIEIAPADGGGDTAFAIFHKMPTGVLNLIEGPSTSFDDDALSRQGVPISVRKVFTKAEQ